MSPKRHIAILLPIILSLLLSSGCAVNRTTATKDPMTDLSSIKSFKVMKNPDDQGICLLIENKLKHMGFLLIVAEDKQSQLDAIVTYKDNWTWDIPTYLVELTIVIREPKTDYPLASGNSFHISPKKTPEDMVNEVINNIFNQRR